MPPATILPLTPASTTYLHLLIRPLASARRTPLTAHSSYAYTTTPATLPQQSPLPNDNDNSALQSLPVTNDSAPMDWNEYFRLRKTRRRFEWGLQIPSALAGLVGGGAYFSQLEIDPTQTVMGFDPLIMYGLGTLSCGVAGILAGPVLGNWAFRATHGRFTKQMDKRDKDFFTHIIRNRADARLNSIRNPVPDYYGEKINSVSEYRSWLRKQREHTRKGVFGGRADDLDS